MEFNNNYYERVASEIKNAIQKLKEQIYIPVVNIDIKGFVTKEPVSFQERLNHPLKQFKIGESWGNLFDCGWFNLEASIPNFNQNNNYYIYLDFNGELLLYDNLGLPLKGFTNVTSVFDRALGEPGKTTYPINKLISSDGKINVWVEGGCNDLFGFYQDKARIVDCRICLKDEEKEKLHYDLEFLLDLMKSLDHKSAAFKKLYLALKNTTPLITYDDPDFVSRISLAIKPFLDRKNDNHLCVSAVGHCHMDLAWLWPIRETKRKILRNLSNTIYLLEKYPSYIFGISQPQQLEWVKEISPKLFEKVKEYIIAGRIEPQGGMWVEADTNLPSGESLVRQMLYGINFWQQEFGKRVRNLWLPDVFGYNGNIPLIMKQSGLDYFMTIKICWNLNNVFPHKSFTWQGINGDQVIAHMPPEGTYNSAILPSSMLHAVKNYPEIKLAPQMLSSFGIGDGGGGPGEEHLERIKRLNQITETPRVKMQSAQDFFEEFKVYQPQLPVWSGELYLENHQGTFSSGMANKSYNHLLEEKLRAAEALLVTTNKRHLQPTLDSYWKEVLLYQFHDILPGSSIMRVYDESIKRYEILSSKIDELLSIDQNSHSIFNHTTSVGNYFKPYEDKVLSYEIKPLATCSATVSNLLSKKKTKHSKSIKTKNLTIVVSNETGFITSIKTHDNKNLLGGLGTRLCGYIDLGNGWDIKDNYRLQTPTLPTLISQKHLVFENNFEAIVNTYKLYSSTIKEQITFDIENDLIMYTHDIDFKDLQKMIRFELNTTISSKENAYGIQFGHIMRKTTNNNSIEEAQYEVPGQRWACIKEENKGLAIISQDRYGYYGKGKVLDINLLRSSTYPGTKLGLGKHHYQFMIMPLVKNESLADVELTSQRFTSVYFPLNDNFDAPVTIDNEQIVLSSLKPSIDKNGIICRLANYTNTVQTCQLSTNLPFTFATLVTTAEEDINEIDLRDTITLKPFSFITIKLKEHND